MPNLAGCKKKIMPSNKSPVFRKVIIPWYHSKTAYGMTITFMLLVFLFGWVGISVARENTAYAGYIWVPIVLVVLSGGIMIFSIVRLIRRHTFK
jgi:hypothetical protein